MKPFGTMLAASAMLMLAACASTQQQPEEVARATSATATAVVEAVNTEKREVMLKTEDGRSLTIVAGPEVANFDQIDVGDTVRVSYAESIAVSMAQPGAATRTGDVEVVEVRAEPGTKPGSVIAAESVVTVVIESYDPVSNIVVFKTPDGFTHSLVVDPAMREFASRRKPGDRVDVTYTMALATVVEELP